MGAIIAVGCAIFGLLGTWNWRKAKKFNEETQKEVGKLKVANENILREFARNYLQLAGGYLPDNELCHFSMLDNYCKIYWCNKITLDETDLIGLDLLNSYIKYYEENKAITEDVACFLYSFLMLKRSYENEEKIKELWENLCGKFGGKQVVSEAIRRFSDGFKKYH